ncbi:MAG: NAD(P)/FAD-dependent oxidoreductase [Pseudomonadota bacterium]
MTDAIIIGAGHNGLTCACYLAAAGLRVKVLERRSIVGGAAVTEEFHPGFRNSTASYTVSLLNPKVISDLDLYGYGLRTVIRDIANFWPLGTEPGDYLKMTFEEDRNREEFARLSPEDAAALPRYSDDIGAAADVLRELVLDVPPNLGGGISDMFRALKTGNRLRRLSTKTQTLILDLFTKSAAEFLQRYFSHPGILGAFAFDGIVGNYASPHAPGTAYVLLHHMFGEVNGKQGYWGHAIGGMGAITEAMARCARDRGVEIETDAPVANVLTQDGVASGVRLEDGRELTAGSVIANVNPKLLFGKLVDRAAQPPEFATRMDHYACGSGTFRMNVALSALPDFVCLPNDSNAPMEHHRSGIIIGPSLEYLDTAYLDARRDGWSRAPVVEMLLPSTMDDSLASAGQHVASLFCQHFAPTLADGRSWDDAREAAADTIIDTVTRFAPNFRSSIIARQIHSPLDLERKFGLTGGDIFHGRLSLDQMFSARPQPGAADHRMPIKGLYLCGSGAHPGGGVTGAPGHNAAKIIIGDLGRN